MLLHKSNFILTIMLQLQINLAKVHDARIEMVNGTTCLVIPSSGVWIPTDQQPDKPIAMLNVDVFRHMPNAYDYTATCRQHFNDAWLAQLSDAERQALPVIGRGK